MTKKDLLKQVIELYFNLRQINWKTENSSVNENHSDTKFLEAVRDNFLFQHVKQATRMRDN